MLSRLDKHFWYVTLEHGCWEQGFLSFSLGVKLTSQPARILDESFYQYRWNTIPLNWKADSLDSVRMTTQCKLFHHRRHEIAVIIVRVIKYYVNTCKGRK